MTFSRFDPLVSIIIPVKDSSKTIEEALLSLCLQTYKNIQTIIIDDGCRDDTVVLAKKIMSSKNLVILSHPNKKNYGPCISRCCGLARAEGDYICFLDGDDMFQPDKLEYQLQVMQNNSNCILSHTDVNIIGDVTNKATLESYFNTAPPLLRYCYSALPDFLINNHICNSSVMIRRSAIQYFVALKLKYQFEDWLQWIILSHYGYFFHIPVKLTNYRMSNESFSGRADCIELCLAKIEILAALINAKQPLVSTQFIYDKLYESIKNLSYFQQKFDYNMDDQE